MDPNQHPAAIGNGHTRDDTATKVGGRRGPRPATAAEGHNRGRRITAAATGQADIRYGLRQDCSPGCPGAAAAGEGDRGSRGIAEAAAIHSKVDKRKEELKLAK